MKCFLPLSDAIILVSKPHTAYPCVLLKIILFILYLKSVQKENEIDENPSEVFHFKITAEKDSLFKKYL